MKGIAWISGSLIVMVVAGIGLLTQLVNPNDLKPAMGRWAKHHQMDLEIRGDMEWTFYPWLGISVKNVRLRAPTFRLEAERLAGSVSILSLVSSDVLIIDRLTAIAPVIELADSPLGVQNATPPGSPNTPLAIRELVIDGGTLTGLIPDARIERVNLTIDSLTPGQDSPMAFSGSVRTVDGEFPFQLTTTLVPSITFDGFTLKNLALESRTLKVALDGYLGFGVNQSIHGEGSLSVDQFSPRQWLNDSGRPLDETLPPSAFESLSAALDFQWSNDLLVIQPLTVRLDESTLKGRASLAVNPLSADLDLHMDALTLERYQSAAQIPVDQNQAQNANQQTTPSVFALPGTYRMVIDTLTTRGVPLAALTMDLAIDREQINILALRGNALGGVFEGSGTHFLSAEISQFSGQFEALQLAQLPLEPPLEQLSGQAFGTFDFRAAGLSGDRFKASLTGPLKLRIENAGLGPLDVSAALCQAIGQRITAAETVPDSLAMTMNFRQGVGDIEALTATVANLGLNGNGRLSLISSALNFKGEVKIPESGDLGACSAPQILKGFQVPLQCQGQLSSKDFSCGLDQQAISSQLSLVLQNRLSNEAQNLLKQELDRRLDNRLNNQFSDQINQLFGR